MLIQVNWFCRRLMIMIFRMIRILENHFMLFLIVSLILLSALTLVMGYIMIRFPSNCVRIDLMRNLICLSDMCTDGRFITNKYTGSRFYVKCGKCKSCLQEKSALRANRIRREFRPGYVALFVTLTYDRISCPYVKEDDLLSHKMVLSVYREHSVHRSARDGRLKRKYGENEIGKVVIPPEDSNYFVGSYKWLKYRPHKVGVCWFKDFQDFIKRLRVNCSRSLINHEGFSIFDCTEYGPKTKRPHIHFTLFIRSSDEAFYRSAILQAWPFASRNRTSKYIELARDPASYLASYVNCTTSISSFFAKYFKPKHSYSKYFGTCDPQFTLSSVLSKVDRGDLTYVVQRNKHGVREDVNFLIPKYVINRYFPLFKGYSRLTSDEVSYHLYTAGSELFVSDYDRPAKTIRYAKKIDYDCGELRIFRNNDGVNITRFIPNTSDLHRISTRLAHAYDYYHRVTGRNRIDYSIDFKRVWTAYASQLLKMSWQDSDRQLYEHYDNIYDVYSGIVENEYLDKYLSSRQVFLHPNDFPCNRSSTSRMSKWFDLYDKQRKVTNDIMSRNNHFV